MLQRSERTSAATADGVEQVEGRRNEREVVAARLLRRRQCTHRQARIQVQEVVAARGDARYTHLLTRGDLVAAAENGLDVDALDPLFTRVVEIRTSQVLGERGQHVNSV